MSNPMEIMKDGLRELIRDYAEQLEWKSKRKVLIRDAPSDDEYCEKHCEMLCKDCEDL